MPRPLNAHQMYLIEEFAEEYKERKMSRRDLLRRALLITGSIPVTASVLAALGCGGDDTGDKATPTGAAAANTLVPATVVPSPVPPTVAVGAVGDISFKGPASDIKGYLALPEGAATKKSPAVLIIHENRGLTDHFRDVARRYAKEGFVAFAIDLISRKGGTSATDAAANSGGLGSTNPDDLTADMQAAVTYLKAHATVQSTAIGVTGFCFGGGYAFELGISSKDIKAAVPYYGTVRRFEELGATQAAFLVMYGGTDARVTGQAEQVRARLTAAGKPFEIKIWDGAGHAFFNDTGANYNATVAQGAWTQTLAWFKKYLVA